MTRFRHERALLSKQARISTLNRKNCGSSLVVSLCFGQLGSIVDQHAEMASK